MQGNHEDDWQPQRFVGGFDFMGEEDEFVLK